MKSVSRIDVSIPSSELRVHSLKRRAAYLANLRLKKEFLTLEPSNNVE